MKSDAIDMMWMDGVGWVVVHLKLHIVSKFNCIFTTF